MTRQATYVHVVPKDDVLARTTTLAIVIATCLIAVIGPLLIV